MAFFRIARVALSGVLFALYSMVAAPHLYGLWLWCVAVRTRPEVRRRRAAHWRAFWAYAAFGMIARVLALGVRLTGRPTSEPPRPSVVVSNHQSLLDIVLLIWVLRKIGLRDVRWVLKEGLRHRSGFIGHACVMSECAFVRRSGSEEDLETVAVCARKVRSDGASVVIFPEGTRYGDRKRRGGFRRLLPPKTKGFGVLREELPDHDVLSITLDWRRHDGTSKEKGIASIVGKTILVEWEIVGKDDVDETWLDREWERKDRRLQVLGRHA